MWLSKRFNSSGALSAETAVITSASEKGIEAVSSLCEKNIESFAPYGYSYAAPSGQEVLLINGGDGSVSAGIKMHGNESLCSGEVCISSLGGASIFLRNDGSVVINESITITDCGSVINRDGEVIVL